MQIPHWLVQEAADAISLNGGQELFERLSISIEGVIPDGRVSFLVEHLEHPVEICAGGPVNAQNNGHIIIDELAGEFRKLVLLIVLGHQPFYSMLMH
ncbi:hypothetical protein EV184_102445 [Sinorhizobium americanum]|uniref:Uncharacterized protein n=1 Tax=Sinorhizobium americanum TaxID=194963 RepID=A0A4R2C336_9HYPH|nr:hypothetical protein EV184_102445 [Sinorhizobium americanum]